VQEDQLGVDEMGRVCKKNGIIYITVPAHKFLWSEHDVINHHVRRYKAKDVLRLFLKYKIIYYSYFNIILFIPIALVRVTKTMIWGLPQTETAQSDFKSVEPTIFSKISEKLFSIENWFIKKNISFPIGVSFLIIARKKD
jgi:hypothetical protein